MTNSPSTRKSQQQRLATIISAHLAEFDTIFPTQEDCVEEIYSRSEEILLKCQQCFSEDIDKPYGARVATCNVCKKRNFLTAGTFFHGMKNARDWLFAIWLIGRGVSVSSSAFHEATDYSQSSALNLFNKIATVVDCRSFICLSLYIRQAQPADSGESSSAARARRNRKRRGLTNAKGR